MVPYPLIETQSWSEVRTALAERGLLGKPDTFVVALKWHEAARLDVALAGAMPVGCWCDDARGYGVIYDVRDIAGHNVLIMTPELRDAEMQRLSQQFVEISKLDTVVIHRAGQPVQSLQIYSARAASAPGR